MSKVNRSISTFPDLWEQFKKKAQKEDKDLSEVINGFLREYTGEEITGDRGKPFLNHSELSDKRKKIVRLLVKNGVDSISQQSFYGFVRKHNIYDRNDYITKAMKAISKEEAVPYKVDGDRIEAREFECYCGAKLNIKIMTKKDGNCPSCQTNLINLDVGMDGFKVL